MTRQNHQTDTDQPSDKNRLSKFKPEKIGDGKRGNSDYPEAAAFKTELREDESGGESGKGQRADGKIEKADHRVPERILKIVAHVSDIQDIDDEESDDNDALDPLGRVSDKGESIFI